MAVNDVPQQPEVRTVLLTLEHKPTHSEATLRASTRAPRLISPSEGLSYSLGRSHAQFIPRCWEGSAILN